MNEISAVTHDISEFGRRLLEELRKIDPVDCRDLGDVLIRVTSEGKLTVESLRDARKGENR